MTREKAPSPNIREDTPSEEIATLVCSHLEADGISVVLSGGAAVSIYSENEYESYDLDFIPIGLARRVDRTMKSLGFARQQRHWVHPQNAYWVEFPSGPVAIGDEMIHDFAERRIRGAALAVLSCSWASAFVWMGAAIPLAADLLVASKSGNTLSIVDESTGKRTAIFEAGGRLPSFAGRAAIQFCGRCLLRRQLLWRCGRRGRAGRPQGSA